MTLLDSSRASLSRAGEYNRDDQVYQAEVLQNDAIPLGLAPSAPTEKMTGYNRSEYHNRAK